MSCSAIFEANFLLDQIPIEISVLKFCDHQDKWNYSVFTHVFRPPSQNEQVAAYDDDDDDDFSSEEKRNQIRFNSKNFHGLSTCETNAIEFGDLPSLLDTYFQNVSTVYVKGLEKAFVLQKFLSPEIYERIAVTDLKYFGCPRLNQFLPSNDILKNCCSFHQLKDGRYSIKCAKSKSIILFSWLKNHEMYCSLLDTYPRYCTFKDDNSIPQLQAFLLAKRGFFRQFQSYRTFKISCIFCNYSLASESVAKNQFFGDHRCCIYFQCKSGEFSVN